MEHSHVTYTHSTLSLAVNRDHVSILETTVEVYSPERLQALAADRLEIFGQALDCTDADPMWCAAVLFLYPLLSELLACD